MEYRPLPDDPKLPPVALISEAGPGGMMFWREGEDGPTIRGPGIEAREGLRQLRGHTVYARPSLEAVREATGPGGWEQLVYGDRVAWQRAGWMEGHKVKVLSSRGILTDHPAETSWKALLAVKREADRWAIPMGSLSAMGRNLWRRTLPRSIRLTSPTGREGLYGGRKEAKRRIMGMRLEGAYSCDIRSAFPHAMGIEPFGRRLVAMPPTLEPHHGIGRASVRVPPMEWSPLADRVARWGLRWETDETLEGWWPLRELRMAQDYGARVRLHETYAARSYELVDLFGEWARIVCDLRAAYRAPVSTWWKAASNSTWGTFCLSGAGQLWTFGDDGEVSHREPYGPQDPPPPSAAFVGAETQARVRERLYREGLMEERGAAAFYVDTDGLIAWRPFMPAGAQDDPAPAGTWRVAERWTWIKVLGSQHYGGLPEGEDRPIYKVAGRSIDAATWARISTNGTGFSYS